MPDDMLKDAIETARRVISEVEDFEVQGKIRNAVSAAALATYAERFTQVWLAQKLSRMSLIHDGLRIGIAS